jgi:ABC-type Fe3+/spermidine/putrescine transport system ATPase subunit/nucleotide-binding universal stress UspA family protein
MSIVLDRLTKRFGGGQPIVDQLSLELNDGELFVLLGSSGSGKSTVLRLISGLTSPDSGRIVLHDRDVTDLPPQKRGVGFVFQNYSIFRHMTAARNIEFGLRIRGVAAPERARKREELLDLVGLGGLGKRFAHQLSGGQLQRVALARALAYGPAVLLLDEPFGALDAKIRSQLRRSFRDIQKQLSVTTILVTHDQDEAFEVGDRIGVLDRGRLLEQGNAIDLYERPRSLFVATFLGAGTVLVGRAESGIANFGGFSLPIPSDVPHENGARVQVLCRPENVVVSADPIDPELPSLGRGSIADESFAGALRRLRLRLPRVARLRQVAPIPAFGEEGLLVDALVPSDRPLPSAELWVGLRAWKILERPAPRVLALDRGNGPPTALAAAMDLARALRGTVTSLGVVDQTDHIDAFGPVLRARAEALDGPIPEVKIRAGRFVPQLLTEQREAVYDVLVLDGGSGRGGRAVKARAAVLNVVEKASTPMVIVKGAWSLPRRLLVCTAVGEPGKTVIRVAGWLARNIGASVILYHAQIGEGEPAFVRLHLERGLAALRALDVSCELSIQRAKSPAEGILAESARFEAGLIAIGSHGPRSRSVFARDDVTLQILASAERPLLIVPESAW